MGDEFGINPIGGAGATIRSGGVDPSLEAGLGLTKHMQVNEEEFALSGFLSYNRTGDVNRVVTTPVVSFQAHLLFGVGFGPRLSYNFTESSLELGFEGHLASILPIANTGIPFFISVQANDVADIPAKGVAVLLGVTGELPL